MKIWTENDMAPIIENLERETEAFARYGTNRTPFILRDTRAAISAGEQELDDLTICGFAIGDLVPLAAILREKGVRPKDVTDWRKDLQGLLDFVADQEMEAHKNAVADLLKRFEGPDEETEEWFAKAVGRKGEEGEG